MAIARALANDPPILVADEPTGNLDSKTSESVFRLFESQVAEGKTILMVTHDHDLAERVNRQIILVDGKIIQDPRKPAFAVSPRFIETQPLQSPRTRTMGQGEGQYV